MSLFDLKQNADELPSLNQGIAKLTYQQVQTTRNATGTAFPDGNINFKFEVSGVKWWIPSRSYIRIRCKYYTGAGLNQPLNITDIAPNMGVCSALFSSAEFQMGGKTVSRVSNYMAQVDAVQKRLKKSKAWMDGVGDSLEKWNPDFNVRQNEITSDGYIIEEKTGHVRLEPAQLKPVAMPLAATMGFDASDSEATWANLGTTGLIANTVNTFLNVGDRVYTLVAGNFGGQIFEITEITGANTAYVKILNQDTTAVLADIVADANGAGAVGVGYEIANNKSQKRSDLEFIWQPPLSIFGIDHGIPSSKLELILTPFNKSEYKRRAIESLKANLTPSDPTVPNQDFDFAITDMYLYAATVEGPAVDSLSYFMSLEETRCQSVEVNQGVGLQQQNFDVSPSTYALSVAFQSTNLLDTRNSASKFKFPAPAGSAVPSGELNFNRFFIQYNGEQKPSPDADPNYASPAAYIASRYAETLLYSNAYFDQGGGESLQEFIDRGLYMYYAFPKDGSSESTRVNVNFQFATDNGNGVANCLLFDHHKKMVLVSISNGRIVDLIEQDG